MDLLRKGGALINPKYLVLHKCELYDTHCHHQHHYHHHLDLGEKEITQESDC